MPSEHGTGEARKRASALQAVAAVLSAFIGIRKSSARDRDLATVKPLHVIIAGVVAAAIFVITIVTVVRMIT